MGGAGKLKAADQTDLAFLSKFSLAVEHTWGTDTKTWLDFDHYTPDDLASMLSDAKYRTVTGSWVEKRADIDDAVAGLPGDLRAEAEKRLTGLLPVGAPDVSSLAVHAANVPFNTGHFSVALDPADRRDYGVATQGAEMGIGAASAGAAFVSNAFQGGLRQVLGELHYGADGLGAEGFRQAESGEVWGAKQCLDAGARRVLDGRDGGGASDGGAAAVWSAGSCERDRLAAGLLFGITVSEGRGSDSCASPWLGKRANRMPEALWFTFNPAVFEAQNWTLTKVGQRVSPFDVVSGGNRHMHAVSAGLAYRDARGALEIEALDAGLVSLGEMSPIYFSKAQPDLSNGVHFNLFNNGWGTNYVQWFGEDMRFRFVLRMGI